MFSFGSRTNVTASAGAVILPDGCGFLAVDTSAGAVTVSSIVYGDGLSDGDVVGLSIVSGANALSLVSGGNLRTSGQTISVGANEKIVTFAFNGATGHFDLVATGTATVTTT